MPVIFFTDGTSGCYHTSQDDLEHLDTDKLARQIDLGEAVARAVAEAAPDPPSSATPRPPPSTTPRRMLAVVRRAEADLGRFAAEDQAAIEQFLGALEAIVDNGETEFGDDDADTLLTGTAAFVELFTKLDCDGFLGAPEG